VQGQLVGIQAIASPFADETETRSRVILSAGETITVGGTRQAALGLVPQARTTGSVDAIRVATSSQARDTLQRADAALQTIATQRARIGATLSRFESLIGDLDTAGNNLAASRSRITDADVAAETATLTRAQIVQQASQAMLAQANGNARGILALLRGDR
jgi:flagellin